MLPVDLDHHKDLCRQRMIAALCFEPRLRVDRHGQHLLASVWSGALIVLTCSEHR
jgi:hypothetical protein